MKTQRSTLYIGLAVAILIAAALFIIFGTPRAAAACDVYTPCGGSYGYQNIQYPIPQYMYFQDPARYYNQSYTPVMYPIPMYVQTGRNPSTVNYGTYSQQYPNLSYVPTTGTPVYGSYSYPTNSYNQPYSNYGTGYNSGFTMSGGSQAGYGGASNGGFINTSGR